MEAAQAAEREQRENALNDTMCDTALRRLAAAKVKADEAKRAVVEASDRLLINLDRAKCTRVEDGVMIRAAIEGAKDGITSLLARLIRDDSRVSTALRLETSTRSRR